MPPAPKRAESGPAARTTWWPGSRPRKWPWSAASSKPNRSGSRFRSTTVPRRRPASRTDSPRLRANLVPTSQWVADAERRRRPARTPGRPPPRQSDCRGAWQRNRPQAAPSQRVSAAKWRLDGAVRDEGGRRSTSTSSAGAPACPAQVRPVVSKGSVHLTQAQKDGAEPLAIDGDVLEVQNRGPNDQVMVVHGQPAHVRNRGPTSRGAASCSIVRRTRPTSTAPDGCSFPSSSRPSPDGPSERPPFDVNWQTRCTSTARLALSLGAVRSKMDDGEENTEVRCRQMGVTLSKPFSFTQEHKEPGAAGGRDDRLLRRRRIRQRHDARRQIDGSASGDLRAAPLPQADRAKARPRPRAVARLAAQRKRPVGTLAVCQRAVQQPSQVAEEDRLGIHAGQIRGQMDGDFQQMLSQPRDQPSRPGSIRSPGAQARREVGRGRSQSILGANGAWTTVFHDHVEVLYGPVDQPMDTVSRDYLQDQSGWLGCETLRVDQHPQTDDQGPVRHSAGHAETARSRGRISSAKRKRSATTAPRRSTFSAVTANRKLRLWSPAQGGGRFEQLTTPTRFSSTRNTTLVRARPIKNLDGVEWIPVA